MYIATHNIWDTNEAYSIGRKIARSSAVICGIQELEEDHSFGVTEASSLMTGLGAKWSMTNEAVSVPLVFNSDYLRLAKQTECPPGFQFRGVLKLHEGNDFTPGRYLSWAIFKHLMYPAIPPVAFVNFHLQHRAWNGKERNARKLAIRRDLWYTGYEQAQWVVVNLLKNGLTTVWMGDYNRRKATVPVAAPRQEHLAGDSIDQIYIARGYSPKAARFKAHPERAKNIPTPSDHPLVLGNVQLLMP